ncbi:MAG: universal stress protein [Ktedonobacteraceae bacterium]|nr:universal stress protein [Ktedonobacteraceae bacterium]
MIHHVLVATDGSENARRAVSFSAQVADRRQQAEVTVVYVHLRVSPGAHSGVPVLEPQQPLQEMHAHLHDMGPEERAHAQEVVDRAVEEIRSLITSQDVTVSGRVVVANHIDDGILQTADEVKADIIVVGTRGLSTLRGAIMGSISHALIEKAHCPVLVVK